MFSAAITGTGVFTPSEVITNDELVASFNAYIDLWNADNAAAIAAGEVEARGHSSSDFILAASGIERRHVMDKAGVLDPNRMFPRLAARGDDEPSIMAEMAVAAARVALDRAGLQPSDIDLVICAASNHERAYPAIAVEIQALLGTQGFAFASGMAATGTILELLDSGSRVVAMDDLYGGTRRLFSGVAG